MARFKSTVVHADAGANTKMAREEESGVAANTESANRLVDCLPIKSGDGDNVAPRVSNVGS